MVKHLLLVLLLLNVLGCTKNPLGDKPDSANPPSVSDEFLNDAPVALNFNTQIPEDTLSSVDLQVKFPSNLVDCETRSPINVTVNSCVCSNNICRISTQGTSNYSGLASVEYRVKSKKWSNWATANIDVTSIHDPAITSNGSLVVIEDTPKNGNLVATSVENSALIYSIVSQGSKGSVTITNVNTGAFTYTPNLNANGSDSFTFKVNDGTSDSNISTVNVTITPVNDAPVVTPHSISTTEDVSTSGNFLAVDPEGSPVSYFIVSQGTKGTLTLNMTSGAYTYTPNLNANGSDSVSIKANDGSLDSAVVVVPVTITPANDAPIANNGSLTTNEDTVGSSTLSASDIDGDALTYSVVSQGSKGSVVITNVTTGAYTYTPNANQTGADTFTFRVNDGTTNSNIATVSVNITPVNDDPVATNGTLTTNEDTMGTGTLVASDLDGNPLVYSVVSQGTKGTVVITNSSTGAYTYTPNLNANGSDSFTFRANDGTINSNIATVSVNITPVNDAPVTSDSSETVSEDQSKTIHFVASDVDGDYLTYEVLTPPSKGVLIPTGINSDFTYIPNANATGADSITFRVNDGFLFSNVSTLTVNISNDNDAPVASNGSFSTLEDTALSNSLSASDLDGDTLTYSVVSQGSKGSVVIQSNGSFVYTPNANANGIDSFSFKVNDGSVDSNVATININITPVNDAPVSTNGTLTTNEDTVGSGTLVASDVDGDTLSYQVVAQGTKGTVVITNSSTGAYTYTPNANATGSDSFTFQVYDGSIPSNVATINVTINSQNDAPVANNDSFNTTEDVSVGGVASASDTDGDTLNYSVVSQGSKGTLSLNSSNGSFTYTPNLNANGVDTVTFKVNDGTIDSNVATLTFNIAPVNDAPETSDKNVVVSEDSSITETLFFSDVDGDSLSFQVVTPPTNGNVSINALGYFTYTPNPNYKGNDSFTFKANDGNLDSNISTVSIVVNNINDLPTTTNLSFTTEENETLTNSLTAADIDGDGLLYIIVSQPSHGTLTLTDANTGAFSYVPDNNYNGVDSFTFRVEDGVGSSNVSTANISIDSVNDAPVAHDGSLTTNEDTVGSGSLTATDEENNPLTYSIVSQGTKGTVVITNSSTGAYTYTPNANSFGADSFTFKANDGTNDSNVATISVTISSINDAPIANDDSFTTNEDTAHSGSLTSSDVENDSRIYSIMSQGTKGSVVITNASTGAFTYTPHANANGSDSFTFRVSDGISNSNTATISVSITPINDAPVSSNGTLTTNEDTVGSGTLSASDIDGDALTYSIVAQGSKGTAVITNSSTGAYTYTPNTDTTGSDSFTFQVYDGTVPSNVATVTVTISPINDNPVANNASFSTNEDTALNQGVGSLVASDTDGDSLSFLLVTGPTHGTLTLNVNGSFVYTPSSNYNGSDSFTYKVTDGIGNSNVATVSLTITPVNDAPVSSNGTLTTNEDTMGSGTLSASDIDGDSLTYAVVSPATHGTVIITNASTGAYTYTPNADYIGSDSFTFKSNDGTLDSNVATVNITISPINDAPIANNGTLTTNEDVDGSGTLTATDVDGDALTYSVVAQGSKGSVIITDASSGAYTYMPFANANGSDSFTFRVSDGTSNSNVATISVTIIPVNDAPVANNGTLSVNEDSSANGTLSATDIDGDALTYSVVSQGSKGNVIITNTTTGAYTYTPNADAVGSDSFTFRVSDGTVNSNTATITVTISPANDAPISSNGALTTNEDTVGSGTLVATDVDGDTLTYSIVSQGSKGTVAITNAATGAYTYTPNLNANGSDSFTFRSNDGTTNSNVSTISVTINPVNDAPVATTGSFSVVANTTHTGSVSATDVDGDALTYTIVTSAGHGTVTITNAATGAFTYTPSLDYVGNDSFIFRASDGSLNSTATINITVTPVIPSAPVLSVVPFTQALHAGLGWTASTGTGPITYTLFRSTSSGTGYSATSCANLTTRVCDDSTGLTAGTTYYYQVAASGPGGVTYSNEVSIVPMSSFSITSVSSDATSSSTGTLLVAWAISQGRTSYDIYYKLSSGSYTLHSNTTSNNVTIPGLTSGQTYSVYIVAKNADGTVSTSEMTQTIRGLFTDNFNFNNSTAYTGDVDAEVTGGVGRLTPSNLVMEKTLDGSGSASDNTFDGFESKDTNVVVSGDKIATNNSTTGNFISKPLDGKNAVTAMSAIPFVTTLPFGKELALAQETGYTSSVSNFAMNLVSVWRFNEAANYNGTAGEVIDAMNTNNGKSSGSIAKTTSGILHRAMVLDGSSKYIEIPDSTTLDDTNKLTISTWVYPTGIDGNDRVILCKRDNFLGFVNNESYCLYFTSGNKIAVHIDTDNNEFTSNTTFANNQWYHIVLVYDGTLVSGSRAKLYVNGVLDKIASESSSSIPNNDSKLFFGFSSTGHYVGARIDETALWKGRSITAPEIGELYRRGANRVKIQVRTCTSISGSSCAGTVSAWTGPDGTASTFFSELYNTSTYALGGTVNTTSFANVLASYSNSTLNTWVSNNGSRRYIQFKATLESSSSTLFPELTKVSFMPSARYALSSMVYNLNAGKINFYKINSLVFTHTCSDVNNNGQDDDIRYSLSVDGSNFYVRSGGAWIADTGFASANPKATLQALTVNDFPVGTSGSDNLHIRAYLTSNGVTPCFVDNIQVTGER